MKCPNCDFENPEDEERCFKCRAYLRQLEEHELAPPRRKGSAFPLYDSISTALRRHIIHHGAQEAEVNLPGRRFQFLLPPMLSLLLPGLGQVYNRKYGKSLLFFGAYVALITWAYNDCFRGNWLQEYQLTVFLHFIGHYSLLLNVVHTWIVYDAYQDAIGRYEKRKVRVIESAGVSLIIACCIWSILFSLQGIAASSISLHQLVHVPNLAQFDLPGGDTLVLDRHYYLHHDVKRGQVVPFVGGARYQEGGVLMRGMNPSIVLGLPGDRISLSGSGIYREKEKVARPPIQWVPKDSGRTYAFTVPTGKYFLLPALTAQTFPGADEVCVKRERLGGKFMLICDPPHRRRALP
jgi:hypothetical protein